ncbi:putative odorant receptor 69a [Eurosta solidaginis]|uniref:putative odorant receptor 69a n=1 Tax=Eurosta solidaginis TaxID=178769 RepID=UPI003530BF8E
MIFEIYNFKAFLEYPELAFKMAFYEPFIWSGNRHRHQTSVWLTMKHFIFVFITLALVTEIFALIINLYIPFDSPENEAFENMEARYFEATALICFFSCGFYKMWNILWRCSDIGQLMEEFNKLFPNASKQRMLAEESGYMEDANSNEEFFGPYRFAYYKRKSDKILGRLTRFLIFTYSYYNIVPLVQLFYEIFSPNQKIMYKTQANVWYPWHNHNEHSSFTGFFLSYVIQALGEFASISFIMSGLHLFCFFTTQFELHFDYLCNEMSTLDASSPDAVKKLKILIGYYNHLKALFIQANSIFNLSIMLDLIVATFAISLMGLAMIILNIYGALMFCDGLVFFLVISYVFCLYGDELTSVSQRLSASIFHSNWQEGSQEYRRMIISFIMYTRVPIKYQAYGYTELSMGTYMKMLKLSYQMFTAFHATE